jgi:hypothetical protein
LIDFILSTTVPLEALKKLHCCLSIILEALKIPLPFVHYIRGFDDSTPFVHYIRGFDDSTPSVHYIRGFDDSTPSAHYMIGFEDSTPVCPLY